MNRAVIFGTYEFLGFHLCNHLLEQGIEVTGIHIESKGLFLDEKRLEIGRNANFTEVNYREWNPEQLNHYVNNQTLVIINYYDLFMKNEERTFHNDVFFSFIDRIKSASTMIFLLPIQLLVDKKLERNYLLIEELRQGIKEGNSLQLLYLPTLYGPWQSQSFIFQQSMLKDLQIKKDVSLCDREWTGDALFVEDAVREIVKLAVQDKGEYLLKSSISNHWKECAQYLSLEIELKDLCKEKYVFNGNEEVIKASLPFSKGLDRQKFHLQELLINKE